MTPRQHDFVESTVWFVDSILGAVDFIVAVRIGFEGLRIDDLVGELASNNEGVLSEMLVKKCGKRTG